MASKSHIFSRSTEAVKDPTPIETDDSTSDSDEHTHLLIASSWRSSLSLLKGLSPHINNSSNARRSEQDDINSNSLTVSELGNRQKSKKKILSKCVVAFLMISIILIFVIVGGTILMVKSVLTSQQNSNSMEIGDDNLPVSVLLPLSPYVYSVTIMLLNPGYESAVLYISRIKPSKMTNYLSKVTIPKLSGRSRYNYNYYGADQPIYLISNSRLLYDLIISADTVSKCYARLYLFSDDTNYNNFKNYQVFKSPKAYISSCFQVNKLNTETKIMWAFNITEPSLYYVGVEIDAGVTVTSNISVLRMSYNTTGLSTPNECSEPLSSVNPSCTLILCSSNFICSKLMSCILVKPTGIVKITYTSVSAHIHGQSGVLGFSFSLVMFFIALLAFVTLIFLSLHYRSVIVSHLCLCRY